MFSPSPADARLEALLDALRRSLASSLPTPVSEWSDRVEALYARKAKTTRVQMGQALRVLRGLLPPEATTAELAAGLLDRFVAAVPGRRWATVDGLLRALRAACNLAVRWRILDASPFEGWDHWPEPEPSRRRHLSEAEVARLLESLRSRASTWSGARLHALAAVWAFCGLRRDEALRLRVEDVDLPARVVHVRPHGRRLKTKASAAPVPVPEALASILAEWIPRAESEWVFPGSTRRGPWVGGGAGRRAGDQLRAAAEAIGLRDVTPHVLRHSLATSLAHRGLSPRQLQLILRHSNQETQRLYVHPDEPALVGLMAGFDWGAPARRGE